MKNRYISATGTGFLSLNSNFSFEFITEEQFFSHPHIINMFRKFPGMNFYKSEVSDGYEIIGYFPDGITRILGFIKNNIPSIDNIDTIVDPIDYDPWVHGCRCNIL